MILITVDVKSLWTCEQHFPQLTCHISCHGESSHPHWKIQNILCCPSYCQNTSDDTSICTRRDHKLCYEIQTFYSGPLPYLLHYQAHLVTLPFVRITGSVTPVDIKPRLSFPSYLPSSISENGRHFPPLSTTPDKVSSSTDGVLQSNWAVQVTVPHDGTRDKARQLALSQPTYLKGFLLPLHSMSSRRIKVSSALTRKT